MDRWSLIREGMSAAATARDQLDIDPFGPVDPYLAADKLGVKVVFLNNSMEGFYFKQGSGRILLSSLRPVPRRAFTCAHELGHHWFGHGSTMDELQDDERPDASKPEEVLANAFAAFFLMPSVGLRGAFARRGWALATASPEQIYVVACQFGVGYVTLINHLCYTLREISIQRRTELQRRTPQQIRRQLLNDDYPSLVVVDEHNEADTFDVEKGAAVLLPRDSDVAGVALALVHSLAQFDLYRASRRGVATVSGPARTFDVRVMPTEYVGSATNRFLEDPDEQD